MTSPAAYLRKSKESGTKDAHLALLMEQVLRFGHNGDTVVYDDWNRSGDIDKIAKRTAWKAMCDAIEAGEHDLVFLNSFDRGGRSIEEWLRFVRLARAHHVRVIADGVDYAAAENRDRLIFEAWAAEKELEKAKERSARTKAMRKQRGDAYLGGHSAPYGSMLARDHSTPCPSPDRCRCRVIVVENPAEPIEPLLDAVREKAGNILQACKLLNERSVPSRGGKGWEPRTLTRVLDARKGYRTRRGPRPTRYQIAKWPAPLSRLVECHCGALMTPMRDPRNRRWLSLMCARGQIAGASVHGSYNARSRHVVDAIQGAIGGTREVKRTETFSTDDLHEQRVAIEEDLRRLGRVYRSGGLSDDEFDVEQASLHVRLRELDAQEDTVTFRLRFTGPVAIDWDAPDEDLAVSIHKVVNVVRLGQDMLPAEVVLA